MHAQAMAVTTQALCRTTQTICQCQHYLEADDKAESASSSTTQKVSGIKCKAANDLPGHCATHKSMWSAMILAMIGLHLHHHCLLSLHLMTMRHCRPWLTPTTRYILIAFNYHHIHISISGSDCQNQGAAYS